MTYEEFSDIFMTHIPISQGNMLLIDGVKAQEIIEQHPQHAHRWFNDFIVFLKPDPNDKAQTVLALLLSQIAMYFELRQKDKSYTQRLKNVTDKSRD